MGLIMGSQNIMCSDYGSNISVLILMTTKLSYNRPKLAIYEC